MAWATLTCAPFKLPIERWMLKVIKPRLHVAWSTAAKGEAEVEEQASEDVRDEHPGAENVNDAENGTEAGGAASPISQEAAEAAQAERAEKRDERQWVRLAAGDANQWERGHYFKGEPKHGVCTRTRDSTALNAQCRCDELPCTSRLRALPRYIDKRRPEIVVRDSRAPQNRRRSEG